MTEFPLTQILFWLALFFTPAGTEKIVINSPTGEITLVQTETAWTAAGATFRLNGDAVVISRGGDGRRTDVHDYVAKVHEHDWAKEPKLTLSGLTTVEKTVDGLIIRDNDGDAREELWRVTYVPGVPQREQGLPISVNVLGHVGRPGTYALPAGSRLLDAIAAAGGYGPVKAREPRRTVTVLRGEPGRQPSSFKRAEKDITKESTVTNMVLVDHDTVFVSDPQLHE